MRRICINADDFGLSRGATDAIVECHQSGSVSSTTFMSTMPGAAYAAGLAAANPELGIGLHFNLTLGAPAAPPESIPSLLSTDGQFRRRPAQERAILRGALRTEEIARELEAQHSRMRELGLTPTHIDSHQHIHVWSPVLRVVSEFARKHRLAVRAPWRFTPGRKQRLAKNLKSIALQAMLSHNWRKWAKDIDTCAAHSSIFDVCNSPEQASFADYSDHLARLPSNTELMVHPSPGDPQTDSLVRIGAVGLREYEILKSPKFAKLLKEHGISTCRFDEIAAPIGR